MKAELIEQEVPEAPETFNKAATALVRAEDWQIADNGSFILAGEFRDGLKDVEEEINETFDKPIADAFKAHKSIVAAKKKYSVPLETALKIIKQKMIGWTQEQDRIRRLEQARLEAEGRRKEEERRQESLRIAQEEARRQAEARRAEEQARLDLAATLEAAGAKDAARKITTEALAPVDISRVEEAMEEIKAPIRPAPVILPPSTPKIRGFSSRRIYDAEVIDQMAFWHGIMAGQIPLEAIGNGDESWLNQQAGRLKEALQWPGVKVTWRDV